MTIPSSYYMQHADLTGSAQSILQLIEIGTQQYTRCTVQTQPATQESVQSCVTDAVSRLSSVIPAPLFIYFGASECDSRLWSFVGVALSITLELLHLTAIMYINHRAGDHSHTSFSWLQFLVKLASGLGEPAVQALLLQKANSLVRNTSPTSGGGSVPFVLAAMEFLQPTAAPLVAAISGWYFSRGFGFQVFATEAITTLLGFVMILGFTSFQPLLILAALGMGVAGSIGIAPFLVPIGLLCAVGPWVLVYLSFGLMGLPMQTGLMFGVIEMCIGSETGYGFGLFFICLLILIMVLGFIGLTPIFAIWEAIWVGLKKYKDWSEKRRRRKEEAMLMMGGSQLQAPVYQQHELHAQGSKEPLMVVGTKEVMGPEKTENLFPLARWFRRRFQNTSRLKRGFVKCEVYCPNGYKEATWGGLGFKPAVLLIGVLLQFFGLTA
ncbi:hypothetical protein QBC37DRAFT_377674 [Rhypophila decipiens]|uniref:Uncharacterized protein n=1 Tax=Rhypophila decipiens TaxID=261697 RepID=A0AAN6Y223_9PEZI|nr:hypothetical protein QBC37DRAFT_377674 [Rhypophila decipiens]